MLDIGACVNRIYPLNGHAYYGWSFVANDINPPSISIAEGILNANNLYIVIQIRLKASAKNIFECVIDATVSFYLNFAAS